MSTGVAVAPEVAAAVARGGAVVALESTIICHGMPYPKNLQTAMEVEAIVRENGAIPATIAILDGVPHVGLSSEQLKRLAISGRQFQKTARRDIAHVVSTLHTRCYSFSGHTVTRGHYNNSDVLCLNNLPPFCHGSSGDP
uniref:Indigoidine synthase A family protein n=1 Tax=Arundo donax TaxID=35708 RepID=A0A0A9D1X7_ARUDO